MLWSNHHRANPKFRLSNVTSIFPFKRRSQSDARSSAPGAKTDSRPWAQTFWGRQFIKSTTLMLALICTAAVALADVKITTRSTASGQSFNSTTFIKGARQRTEGMGFTTIYQCDLKRMIQINDKNRTYLITPYAGTDSSKGANPPRPGAKARKGGVITYHTTNVDTGERKQMLNLTAKHIKSKTVVEASEGACTSMNMSMETDGWYVDLPASQSCPADGSASGFPVDQSDCVDEVRYLTDGPANTGYPVMTTTRIKFNAGAGGAAANIPTSESTQEVIDLSTVKLDAALFEAPAGYTEVKSMQELGSPY